jgi:hypothetical protein
MHRAGKPMTLAEWDGFIRGLSLSATPDRGALWSKLDPVNGPTSARHLAQAQGKITLEMKLDGTTFNQVYAAQFGSSQNATTAQIWRWVSQRFVSGLRGHVTAYVDRPLLFGSLKSGAEVDALRSSPVFATEMWDLISIMRGNVGITGFLVYDVKTNRDFFISREVAKAPIQ